MRTKAIRSRFDGQRILIPRGAPRRPCDVVVVFLPPEKDQAAAERAEWMKAQGKVLAEAWDADEDAVYDKL